MSINRSPSCDVCHNMDDATGDCTHPDKGEEINEMLHVQQVMINRTLGGNWTICHGFDKDAEKVKIKMPWFEEYLRRWGKTK